MNPLIIASCIVVGLIVTCLVISLRKRVIALRGEARRKAEAEKAHAASLKLAELRVVAEREKVNLIELAHSVDPDLVNHISLDDITENYQRLTEDLRGKVEIRPDMCSTFHEFQELASRGFPLSKKAAEKMYNLQDFWSLEKQQWSGCLIHKDVFYAVYRPKFYTWLENVQSCAEIARLGAWEVNPDFFDCWQWTPALQKFEELCRREMRSNDLPTLWQLRRHQRTCMFCPYGLVKELFQKILSLTQDINELKRLAYPKTYEDRVETDSDIAKQYYIETIRGLMLKCRSVEDLRSFLSSHEIPVEAKPLSLKLMAELPEHSGMPTR